MRGREDINLLYLFIMARISKLSDKTGLTRIQMIDKIRETQPTFDRKASMTRVEKRYQSLLGGTTKTPTKPGVKKPTVKKVTPKTSQSRKNTEPKISKYTGLTYPEMKESIKKENPAYKKRKHVDIENDYMVTIYNKYNPTRRIKNMNQLELKELSPMMKTALAGQRIIGNEVPSLRGNLFTAAEDRMKLTYGDTTELIYVETLLFDMIRRVKEDEYYQASATEIREILRLLPELENRTRTSGFIANDINYLAAVEAYYEREEQKEEKRGKKR